MNHRAGFINGEGDGVGIHIDIPTELWKEKLQNAGVDPTAMLIKKNLLLVIFLSAKKLNWTSTKEGTDSKTRKL